jgi:hypothetical protein
MLAAGLVSDAAGDEAEGGKELLPAGGGQAATLEGWTSYHQDDAATADVWSLDEAGVLHCTGKPLGYLATKEDHGDFLLELDYRWPPGQEPGKGGVLIRKTGPDKIWPQSLEAQINVGDAGDFWGLDGYSLDGPEERKQTLEHPQFGKLTNLKKLAMVERATGQWNHYKIVADGATVTLEINGQMVNRATNCDPTPGKILLTAEGFPIHFRNLRLTPR